MISIESFIIPGALVAVLVLCIMYVHDIRDNTSEISPVVQVIFMFLIWALAATVISLVLYGLVWIGVHFQFIIGGTT